MIPDGAPAVGSDVSDLLGLDDVVFEFSLSDGSNGGTRFDYENEFKAPGGFVAKAGDGYQVSAGGIGARHEVRHYLRRAIFPHLEIVRLQPFDRLPVAPRDGDDDGDEDREGG